MSLSIQEVEHIAELARLSLTDAEKEMSPSAAFCCIGLFQRSSTSGYQSYLPYVSNISPKFSKPIES
jgi:hypothetical protein